MEQTNLSLWIIESEATQALLPLFSSRKCTQTLSLGGSPLERTLDGMVACTHLYPRKYMSTIQCQDKAPPAFDTLDVGSAVRVDCITHLTQPVAAGQDDVKLARTPAPGSITLQTPQETIELNNADTHFSITPPSEDGFITYRPRLNMVVKAFIITAQEWQLTEGWRLDLEET